ncbi:hypothetical protein RN001_008607 [Aquatica leii]|uniref:Uncharacterized protein n=1 Tax=Aquatica leii TaxID=1421715 RepID=A0AAN7PGV8_9COLE|nr:hypothetical protein RN001_008607 [Aquatica leii]
MFKLAIACLCLAFVCAAPPPSSHGKNDAHIVNQESDLDIGGKYHYSFETSDGTKAAQTGELKTIGNEAGGASKGFYEYNDGGVVYRVDYTADENGFVATGAHIPAIPEPIARALKWAAEHPYKEPERKH